MKYTGMIKLNTAILSSGISKVKLLSLGVKHQQSNQSLKGSFAHYVIPLTEMDGTLIC